MTEEREKQLLETIAEQKAMIAFLRQQIDLMKRRQYGPKSERIDDKQLELLEGLLEQACVEQEERISPQPRKQKTKKRAKAQKTIRYPEDIPVVEEVIEPLEVQAAPDKWRRISQEVTEELIFEPGRFILKRTIRPKYVAVQEPQQAPIVAPLTPRLLERSLLSPELLARIVTAKYVDHLPLYRQESIFESRYGVYLPRQAMARWMQLAAFWFQPIYELLRKKTLASGYVQVDETCIEYLSPGHGKTKQGRLWTVCSPGQSEANVFYQWHTSRAASCLDKVLGKKYKGSVQCDAYIGYISYERQNSERISLRFCWAHVRRKFHEAMKMGCADAAWVTVQINNLYAIEARLRERKAEKKLRAVIRQQEAQRIVERIGNVIKRWKLQGRHRPQSPTGKAIDYTLSLWPKLGVYLTDGRIEIDNNQCENAIRPTAVGKKNWLFVGEEKAGEASAILYTIVENCRRIGLDPEKYMRIALTRLPRMTNQNVNQLLPSNIAKELKAEQSKKTEKAAA